jgi:transcriptional regulator with XRE-family HTH domain
MYCSIGERIMILRKRQKLSKKELADIAGISYATLSNYENGKAIPSAETIVRLALALNVSVSDLISLTDPTASSSETGISNDFPNYKNLLDECNKILKNKIITIK